MRQLLTYCPPRMVSAKWTLPVVAVIDIGQGGGDAAFGHDGVRLAQQRLAHQADRDAGRGRLDGGPQAGAAGADHQHVVFVRFVLRPFRIALVGQRAFGKSGTARGVSPFARGNAQKKRISVQMPSEHRRM